MNPSNARPVLPAPKPRPRDAPTALGGISVLDFSRVIAGPVATMLLADLGAEVIKVENPATGDDSRGLMPPSLGDVSSLFAWANRNKRSITLDLRVPAAQQVARDLARRADVVVENFTTGVMDRFGLSYADLSKENPRLVYCSISAFGRHGRFAARPGYDPVTQAESGFLSMNGFPDQDPVRAGTSTIDISTGMMACNAILGALMARERHGVGQHVETTLFDDAVTLIGQYGMNYLMTGEEQVRPGNGSNTAEPAGLFQSIDGPIYLTCASDRSYRKLAVEVLRKPELADDPRFATNALRTSNRVQLHEALRAQFRTRTREVWLERGQAAGVPIGPVRSVSEAFDCEEMRERGLLSQLPHPTVGTVPNIGPPFRFHGTPIVDPVAAPLLGQHTEEIVGGLPGYDRSKMAELKAAGVFGASAA